MKFLCVLAAAISAIGLGACATSDKRPTVETIARDVCTADGSVDAGLAATKYGGRRFDVRGPNGLAEEVWVIKLPIFLRDELRTPTSTDIKTSETPGVYAWRKGGNCVVGPMSNDDYERVRAGTEPTGEIYSKAVRLKDGS